MRSYVKDLLVSTVYCYGRWETCIFSDDESEVVKYAFSEEDAKSAHEEYVKLVEEDRFSFEDRF